ELLDGDSEFAALRAIGRAQNELTRLAELDPRLQPTRELLDAAAIQLDEANDLLGRYRDALELDPERLADMEAQIAKLHELGRKHRVPVANLKAHAVGLRAELESLRSAGERLVVLKSERKITEQNYVVAAANLSAARASAARQLSADVSILMSELGMAGGRFEAALEKMEKSTPDPQGV